MLNLFSLKEKKEEGGKGPGTKKKASAAQLRITKVSPSLGPLTDYQLSI